MMRKNGDINVIVRDDNMSFNEQLKRQIEKNRGIKKTARLKTTIFVDLDIPDEIDVFGKKAELYSDFDGLFYETIDGDYCIVLELIDEEHVKVECHHQGQKIFDKIYSVNEINSNFIKIVKEMEDF